MSQPSEAVQAVASLYGVPVAEVLPMACYACEPLGSLDGFKRIRLCESHLNLLKEVMDKTRRQ